MMDGEVMQYSGEIILPDYLLNNSLPIDDPPLHINHATNSFTQESNSFNSFHVSPSDPNQNPSLSSSSSSIPTALFPRKKQKTSEAPRTNQKTNVVLYNLREILKNHGKYNTPKSRKWKELYSHILEQNLVQHILPEDAEWINTQLNSKKKQSTKVGKVQETNSLNNTSSSIPINSFAPHSNVPSPDSIYSPNSTTYSPSSNYSANSTSSSPAQERNSSGSSSPALEFIEAIINNNNNNNNAPLSAEVGEPTEIQHLKTQIPPSSAPSSAPAGDYAVRHIQAERVEAVDVRAHRILCNAFACLSDETTKYNIRKLSPEESLAIIRQLKACMFKYTQEYNGGDDRDVRGFIAQEVQRICPDLVQVTPSGILTVRTLEIIPLVCDAIKAMDDKFEGLLDKVSRMSLSPCAPVLLAYFEDNKLQINPQALDILREIKMNVTVLSVCGEGGDGNSSLCNLLLGSKDTDRHFATGNSFDRKTKDVWMSYPMKQYDPKKGEFMRIVIDCQGYDAIDLNKVIQVLSFLCLISSTMVLCQKNMPNNNLFDKLKSMVEVQKLFQKYKLTSGELPALIMLIRDAQLEHDKKIDGAHQLANMLNKSDTDLQAAINRFAPRTLLELQHPREAAFQSSLDTLRAKVAQYCAPRSVTSAAHASASAAPAHGAALAHRIACAGEILRANLSHARVPSFSQLVRCRSVADEVLAEYSDGKLEANKVVSTYIDRTKEIPDDCKQGGVEELQKKVKVSELLRYSDECEEQLKEMQS